MQFRLTHVRLLVTDFAECYRFFGQTLELPLINGEASGPYAEFGAGESVLAVFDRGAMARVVGASSQPAEAIAQDRVALCIRVDDVDAAVTQLKSKGVKFVTEATDRPDWLIRTAHLRAPDGTLVELNSPLKR